MSFRRYFIKNRDEIGREREKKKFSARIPFILNSGKKIPKKIAGKFKKLKNQISREREKKNFSSELHSYSTRARKFRKK